MSTTTQERDNYTFANQSSIPAPFQTQLPAFFRSWDDPYSKDAHAYLQLFSPNATLAFGPTPSRGRDAIRAFRDAMIDPVRGPVVDLQHTLGKFFLLAGGSGTNHNHEESSAAEEVEVIVNGTIWYRLKNGRRIDADFASWIVFAERGSGGRYEADFYEVYLDSLELMGAIKEMNDQTEAEAGVAETKA